jgi:hypothetical protein
VNQPCYGLSNIYTQFNPLLAEIKIRERVLLSSGNISINTELASHVMACGTNTEFHTPLAEINIRKYKYKK